MRIGTRRKKIEEEGNEASTATTRTTATPTKTELVTVCVPLLSRKRMKEEE